MKFQTLMSEYSFVTFLVVIYCDVVGAVVTISPMMETQKSTQIAISTIIIVS